MGSATLSLRLEVEMLPWGEGATLSEELTLEALGSHGGVPRILLAIQSIVRSVNQLVRAIPQSNHSQTEANQAWLAGLARSGEVGLMVSASASSVIEVEPELHGDFLVAFDPLSFGSGGLLASSTFGVWHKGQGDCPALVPGSLLLVSGVVTYGLVTQLVIAGAGGASQYLLDQKGEFLFKGRLSHHSSSSISSNAGSINFSSSSTMNDDDLKDLKDRKDHDDVMELKDLRNTLPALSCLMALEKGQTASVGALPLLTTAAPLAFLARAAGAKIFPEELLNVTPLNLHHRLALTVGPASEVDQLNSDERGNG